MLTKEEIHKASEDIPAIRTYLQSLDPVAPIRINDPCACIYHGYLFHRFPGITEILIHYDDFMITTVDGAEVFVSIGGRFAEVIQLRWSERAREEYGDDRFFDEDDHTLTAAQCIEELDGYEKEHTR